jgi:hypothetical protein
MFGLPNVIHVTLVSEKYHLTKTAHNGNTFFTLNSHAVKMTADWDV